MQGTFEVATLKSSDISESPAKLVLNAVGDINFVIFSNVVMHKANSIFKKRSLLGSSEATLHSV